MLKSTKIGIVVPLVGLLLGHSTPLFCVENPPAPSTLSQALQAPEAAPQEKDSVQQLQQAAGQGDKTAQLELGIAYINGDDIQQNFDEAAAWLLKSAKQGEYHAIVNLMLLDNDQTLSPAMKTEVDAWLKAQGDQLPTLNLPPPAR